MKLVRSARAALVAIALVVSFVAVFLVARPADAHQLPDTIRTVEGCQVRVHRWVKEARCIACIQRGGHFHKRGPNSGYCHHK